MHALCVGRLRCGRHYYVWDMRCWHGPTQRPLIHVAIVIPSLPPLLTGTASVRGRQPRHHFLPTARPLLRSNLGLPLPSLAADFREMNFCDRGAENFFPFGFPPLPPVKSARVDMHPARAEAGAGGNGNGRRRGAGAGAGSPAPGTSVQEPLSLASVFPARGGIDILAPGPLFGTPADDLLVKGHQQWADWLRDVIFGSKVGVRCGEVR